MRASVLRSLLLTALVASVAVRFETNRAREAMAGDFDIGAAVEDVIRANGYALRENPVKPPRLLARVVYFQRPECQQASLVLPHFINEEAGADPDARHGLGFRAPLLLHRPRLARAVAHRHGAAMDQASGAERFRRHRPISP